MNMKRIVIFALAVVLFACDKQDFSEAKIIGKWNMYYVEQNGTDISNQIDGYWEEYKPDGSFTYKDMGTNVLTWELKDNVVHTYNTNPVTENDRIIIKLTNKQLWLEEHDPGSKVILKFKK